MIDLLLALADEPAAAVQEAPGHRNAQADALYITGGAIMVWASNGDGPGGQVSFTVINRGMEPDRVISISTPAGPVGPIRTHP